MHRNSKDNQLLVKKLKPVHKYCLVAIRTTFSTKVVLDCKVQNRTPLNISNLGLFSNSVALTINFKTELTI